MITWMPFADLFDSALVLDNERLKQQLDDNFTIYKALAYGRVNHPAIMLWYGYESAFDVYMNAIDEECRKRGIDYPVERKQLGRAALVFPPWWGDRRLHSSHRSKLIRGNYDYYSQLWPNESDSLELFWPDACKSTLQDI